MGDKHIVLYTSSECTRCKLVKHMLDTHDVPYVEKEITGVPAIETDGKLIDDYSDVLTWLQQNNYYSL